MPQDIDKLVARYDFDLMEQRMSKDFGGDWVRYTDYEALRAELEAVKAELAKALTQDDPAFTYAFKVRAEAAEARVTQLEAENGRLREALERVLNAAGCGVDLYNDRPGKEAIRFARAALTGREG